MHQTSSTQTQREAHAVLVPQADAVGMIGVIRSLGRAGYKVYACSSSPAALGFQSRFVYRSMVHPPYEDPHFLVWLEDYVASSGITAIIPSEGFLVGIQSCYAQYESLLPDAPDQAAVYRCLSKARVFESLLAAAPDNPARKYLPLSLIVRRETLSSVAARLSGHSPPYFIKVDACLGRTGQRGGVWRRDSVADTEALVGDLLDGYEAVLVQGVATGCKATVNLLISDDRVLAETMCVAMHESPHTGGLTSYRRTWWHQAMRDDAEAKLRHLGWQGVAMVEYKWDADTDAFQFIELNSRYWAALHLDLYAGSDIPCLQVDRHYGHRAEMFTRQPLGVRCRYTIPAEYGYAMSRARDPDVPILSRLWTVVEFLLLFLNPAIKADLFFPGDRRLYWRQWRVFLAAMRQSLKEKLR